MVKDLMPGPQSHRRTTSPVLSSPRRAFHIKDRMRFGIDMEGKDESLRQREGDDVRSSGGARLYSYGGRCMGEGREMQGRLRGTAEDRGRVIWWEMGGSRRINGTNWATHGEWRRGNREIFGVYKDKQIEVIQRLRFQYKEMKVYKLSNNFKK